MLLFRDELLLHHWEDIIIIHSVLYTPPDLWTSFIYYSTTEETLLKEFHEVTFFPDQTTPVNRTQRKYVVSKAKKHSALKSFPMDHAARTRPSSGQITAKRGQVGPRDSAGLLLALLVTPHALLKQHGVREALAEVPHVGFPTQSPALPTPGSPRREEKPRMPSLAKSKKQPPWVFPHIVFSFLSFFCLLSSSFLCVLYRALCTSYTPMRRQTVVTCMPAKLLFLVLNGGT